MDGREWMFISAGKTIRLLDWDWDWGTGSWVATATSMQSYVNEAEWSQLERGYYGLHSGVTSTTYDATFDVIVETGNEGERETISHTLRCTDPVPPEPPEPLKPYLTGPEMVRGEWHKGGHWWWPTYALTCSEFDLELVSPDGGPWALVPNGKLEIKYLNWDSFRKQWEQHPVYWWPTTINHGVSDWNMMLAHDYTIVPPITEHFRSLDGYKGVVTVTVIRYTRRLAREASRHHGSPGRRSAGALPSSRIPEVSLAARPRARSSGVDRPAVAPRSMRSRVAGCFPRWWRRELASGRGSDSRRHGISIPRIVFTVLVVGCTADADPTAPLPETIAAGRSAWAAECAPCHTARDGFDIARFGFADADIVQRALGHVSSARPSRAVWNRGLRQEWR